MSNSIAQNAAAAATQVVNSPLQGGGSVAGELNEQKDATKSARETQFGEVLRKMQSQYGAKAEKPREIKKTLGKDDFLRIMVTQMKNQDPTNPFKADQMAAQMAQFASVEQLQNLNQGFNKMTQAQQPAERMALTNMIGRTITVDASRFTHREGENENLNFHLPKDAKEVQVALVAENGETVFTKDLGPQKGGEGSFSWDGKKTNNLPAKSGSYMVRVQAKDERGTEMQIDPKRHGRVVGVSFEGPEPILLVGDAKHQEKIPAKNVVRIEADASAPQLAPAAQSAPQAGGAATQSASNASGASSGPNGNFFTFQKGVGSQNLDPSQAPPEVQAALARYQANQAMGNGSPQVAHAAGGASEEKGFPNGLNELKE